ncbi:tetratricopeptide repeat protein [Aliidiomarina quisquiliarum]|uniref:tetratricopeptide repeat protein n=1 Tax=Aliidiomarina quisquiliarum TaxID=2938947 RepID=UPI00208EE24D|nr:flagellar protein MotX [Aliidiomarina quisquiliarum]MCO4321961.1 flagellar protein MotX [Aliidiomarina quisquiliarum]
MTLFQRIQFFCSYALCVSAGALLLNTLVYSAAEARQFKVPEAVQLYTDDELVRLIRQNSHLQRVRDVDNCQLYQDIKAQAEVERRPAYQFLYGDMLAYAVCYDRNVELGVTYMQEAAIQGLPEALEQLGRYYHLGRLVQPDMHRAILYLREAASLGNLPAQKRFANILLAGHGSALDMEAAYHYLHNAVTASAQEHRQIQTILLALEEKLPARIVERARKPLNV